MNIYYANTHEDVVEPMTLDEFMMKFNADELDAGSCSVFLTHTKAHAWLDFQKDEDEEESLRRDEKHGLYGHAIDDSN